MKPIRLKLGLIALVLSVFCFVIISCSKSDSDSNSAKVSINLTDAPGDYAALWVKVKKIRIHTADDTDATEKNGWTDYDVSVTSANGYINLLKYSNGDEITLFSQNLQVGKITEIRLVLDEDADTYLKLKGASDSIVIKTPSATHSGLKIKVNTQLDNSGNYVFVLDFDVAKGIKKTGSKYTLSPVIRAIIRAYEIENYGTILGNVTPMSSHPSIHVLSGTDTVATAIPRIDGIFKVRGLADGTYTVAVDVVTGSPTTISNVVVSKGVVTNVGTITIK